MPPRLNHGPWSYTLPLPERSRVRTTLATQPGGRVLIPSDARSPGDKTGVHTAGRIGRRGVALSLRRDPGGQQLQVAIRVHVATADHGDHWPLAPVEPELPCMEREGGDAKRARRLDDHTGSFRSEPDGGGDLVLADSDHALEECAQVRERSNAESLGPRPVRDGARHVLGRPANDLAGGERVAR